MDGRQGRRDSPSAGRMHSQTGTTDREKGRTDGMNRRKKQTNGYSYRNALSQLKVKERETIVNTADSPDAYNSATAKGCLMVDCKDRYMYSYQFTTEQQSIPHYTTVYHKRWLWPSREKSVVLMISAAWLV